MRVTEKQVNALEFIHANPESSVLAIAEAAGASTTGSNAADFLGRLIDGGFAQVVLTADCQMVMDNDADGVDLSGADISPAAEALYCFFESMKRL